MNLVTIILKSYASSQTFYLNLTCITHFIHDKMKWNVIIETKKIFVKKNDLYFLLPILIILLRILYKIMFLFFFSSSKNFSSQTLSSCAPHFRNKIIFLWWWVIGHKKYFIKIIKLLCSIWLIACAHINMQFWVINCHAPHWNTWTIFLGPNTFYMGIVLKQ